jgi:predicted nucleic acid-binding protein
MASLSKALAAHTRLGLDTSIFIYHFEAHPDYLPLTRELLSGIEQGRWQGVTSVITLMEMAVRPYQLNQEDTVRKVEALLVNFPNLELVEIDRDVAHRAAKLRAEYHLRTPDALQVAACMLAGANGFITNDRRLTHLSPILDVVVLENFRD